MLSAAVAVEDGIASAQVEDCTSAAVAISCPGPVTASAGASGPYT
ncbi:hypothetical protein [Mycolicibacterium cosmeticum]